jgi:cytoskeletal protein RodZ
MATSKKDYEGIAGAFRSVTRIAVNGQDNELQAVILASERVAEYLSTTNPHFNLERFRSACLGIDYTDANGRTWRYSK